MFTSRVGGWTRAFREFFHTEAASGVLLLACAVAALVWANTPWRDSYADLWGYRLSIGAGDYALDKTLQSWVKDALMVVFFFVVGLEIKRELLMGELASPRRAILPVAAAAGGAIVPALLYLALNAGTDGSRGWGVPMATDIAFALGVLALISGPGALLLRVFLAALAIVDDLLAVLVVAIFYSTSLDWLRLGTGGAVFAGLLIASRVGVNSLWVYLAGGFALWLAFVESGVHPTIAGVLLAVTIPARRYGDELAVESDHDGNGHSLLHRFEHALHPWVAFAIMPIFALANAGVRITGGIGDILGDRVTLGIIVGLIFGKQIGITLATWAAVRLNLATLPTGLSLRHAYAVSWLAGIGFTMSIFIANLAFLDAERVAAAKIGILLASAIAGLIGYLLVRAVSRQVEPVGAPVESQTRVPGHA